MIIAAYGRSNVLRYAIETVRHQTTQDWEVIVVDDASPDDSVAVAESFDDSRIRTVRLVQNVGEQSGPNNVGAYLAAAPLLAFLNQDDLWWPDHLEHLMALHRSTGAPIVHSTMVMKPRPSPDVDEERRYGLRAWQDPYHPRYDTPASCWLIERQLHLRLGGWRPSAMLYGPPSQEFLFRAWRAGARVEPSGVLSVLAEGSARQPGSYRDRHELWQANALRRLQDDPAGLRRSIQGSAERLDQRPRRPRRPLRLLRWAVDRTAVPIITRSGVSPLEWQYRRWGNRRGEAVQRFRTTRGLDARPAGYEATPEPRG